MSTFKKGRKRISLKYEKLLKSYKDLIDSGSRLDQLDISIFNEDEDFYYKILLNFYEHKKKDKIKGFEI